MAGVGGNHGESQDFTQPWKFSDVVLVVEDQKFHVHRAVLAVCSPVFEKMFTSEFQGNGAKQHVHRAVRAVRSPVYEEMWACTSEFQGKGEKEIPIPGKMASEIMGLLQIIYPSVEEKLTEENCHPLLRLADEYQMKAIVQKCENFIVKMMNLNGLGKEVLVELVFAQKFNLQKLKHESIKRAQWLSLKVLKNDVVYNEIHEENLKEIMEGMILLLQNPPNVRPFFRPQLSAVEKR